MKKIIKWKSLVITCLICLIPCIAGVILWDSLPERVAIHFNINNVPDNFASKGVAVFGLCFMMMALQIICCVINDVNAYRFGERKKFSYATKAIIPAMTIVLQTLTLGYALGIDIDIRRWVMCIVAIVFLLIGNYLPKFDHIKNAPEVQGEIARKINRFIGYEMVIMGILAFVSALLKPIYSVIWIILLIPYSIISAVYSYMNIKKNKQ